MSDSVVMEIHDKIKNLTLIQVKDLCDMIADTYGVSAVAVAAPAAGAPAAGAAAQEKTSFKVTLKSAGSNKIALIKVVKEMKAMSLIDAKKFVDSLPAVLEESADKAKADSIVKAIADAGGEAVAE